jgi:mannosylglycerate synthase
VGSGRDTAYNAIAAARPEITDASGTPVSLILQERRGSMRPGKGDAMNTGLAWFLERTTHERVHFYDADITTFTEDWITRAEEAADTGYSVVRHYFPRASTDAMITWFITRTGFALLWPETELPRIEQPLGGELLFSREVAQQLVGDDGVQQQSDWGIDTRYTIATVAAGHPMYESYVPHGKLHKLYGSLTDIKDMAVECFGALQSQRALAVPPGTTHDIGAGAEVNETVRRKVAYSVPDTVPLLREAWTDRQLDMLDLFPPPVSRGMVASREYPRLGFMDSGNWRDTYLVLLDHADIGDRDWRELLFRLWVTRVLTYTVTEAVKGYDAAMAYLRGTIDSYGAR